MDEIGADLTTTDEPPPDNYDVLAPWGPSGPPEAGQWAPDILGEPFECMTLPLLPDDEGEVVATLVRAENPASNHVVLYLHGRNDYFFQVELAERITENSGAFYALDLRKYGRSLRPWQTIGYADNLRAYDEDLSAALSIIHQEHPTKPLILMGHSTGGLIAALWAFRHQGVIDGLALNSAWLELQKHAGMRPALKRYLDTVAARRPRATVIGAGSDHYSRSLLGGWNESTFEVPEGIPADDPAACGWSYAPEWKRPDSYPVPAAWLRAVIDGHEEIERRVHLSVPVLSATARRSSDGEHWTPAVFSTDIVLDVEAIQSRAAGISNCVTLARFDGKHDLTTSDPEVRNAFYLTLTRWIRAVVGS